MVAVFRVRIITLPRARRSCAVSSVFPAKVREVAPDHGASGRYLDFVATADRHHLNVSAPRRPIGGTVSRMQTPFYGECEALKCTEWA